MVHEKIIKREDGSQILIKVKFWVEGYRDDFGYNVTIGNKEAGKRKWLYDGKAEATPAELLQAKLELWQKFKPIQ